MELLIIGLILLIVSWKRGWGAYAIIPHLIALLLIIVEFKFIMSHYCPELWKVLQKFPSIYDIDKLDDNSCKIPSSTEVILSFINTIIWLLPIIGNGLMIIYSFLKKD